MNCKEFQEKLTLLLYDELSSEQRAACEAHLTACGSCRATLDEARRFADLLRQRAAAEPSPELLVHCRQTLSEALDREEMGWRAVISRWLPAPSLATPTRAAAGLTILLFGFGLGWTLRSRPIVVPRQGGIDPVPATSDLAGMQIKDISRVAPDPQTGAVHITLDAERRMTLEGSLDDPRIQQVLVDALKNYSNPGIRRDTLDALRARTNSPNVRGALLYAMRHDANAGVRLEALQDVQAMEWTPDVRQALLETLAQDTNSGVRVAATNAFTSHADLQALPVLQRLATGDPNRYVRLKCADAVRQLGGE